MKKIDNYYSPSDISDKLNLSTSSIRRYTLALENSGYRAVYRDENEHRRYTIEDVRVLQYFHRLVNEKKVPFTEAVKKTIADLEYINNQVSDVTVDMLIAENQTDLMEQVNEKLGVMYEIVKNLDERNTELMNEVRALKEVVGELKTDNKRLLESHENALLIANKENKDESMNAPISDDIAVQMNGFKPQNVEEDKADQIKENDIESQQTEINSDKNIVDVESFNKKVEPDRTADKNIEEGTIENKIQTKQNRIERMREESEKNAPKSLLGRFREWFNS